MLDRPPLGGMEPGDFLSLLREFRATRFPSCGVDRNRWGERARDSVGLGPHGTVWFATVDSRHYATDHPDATDGKASNLLVPANHIPRTTIVEKRYDSFGKPYIFDPLTRRFFGVFRGWLPLLTDLARGGFFRPSDRLSDFLGTDSWKIVPSQLAG